MNVLSRMRRCKHRAFLMSKDLGLLWALARSRASRAFRAQYGAATTGLVLPPLRKDHGIWGICMVRDEADIIESSIRHLADQGVGSFLVVDNRSSDDTLSRLRDLQNEIPGLHVGRDAEPAYYQSAKMTRLADAVRGAGAEWIVPFDADEYWFGVSGTVAETLASSTAAVVRARIHNAFPVADDDAWWLDDSPHPDIKSAFRAWPGAIVTMGNHEILRPGPRTTQLRVVHIPWRTPEQFDRKLRQGHDALVMAGTPDDVATHWRGLGSRPRDEVATAWASLLQGDWHSELVWRPYGRLHPMGERVPRTWRAAAATMNSTEPFADGEAPEQS